MARRLATALVLVVLGAAAWWIVRSGAPTAEGLVVHVEVVDTQGRPVTTAQIERVFEGTRLRVDARGRASLTDVVLRELDTPSASSLARALRVHAPGHALRTSEDAETVQREDGSWSLRLQLTAHGILRLYVEETHLGACKAYPEAEEGGARTWEPIEGRQVARHGQPASYRVYAGARALVVRIEGEADRDGAIGVATRRVRVPRPAPGHVVEEVLTPEPVHVILGQVTVEDGPRPPSLGGHAIVTELGEGDARIPLAKVAVADDGRFLARRTGKGRYEIEFHLDFFPGTTTVTVLGGASFEITPARPALWVTLRHPDTDLTGRTTHVQLWSSGEPRKPRPGFVPGRQESKLPMPGAGSYRIVVEVNGTQALPPLRAEARIGVVAGTAEVAVAFTERAHGTVIVRVAAGAFGKARGATVRIHDWHMERRATLIPGLAESATFPHVWAENMDITVEWDEEGRENTVLPVSVARGKTTTVVIEDEHP